MAIRYWSRRSVRCGADARRDDEERGRTLAALAHEQHSRVTHMHGSRQA
jgi:hypothetical protein